jgi:hypothetical protein
MDDNSELGIAITEAKAAKRNLEYAKGFERSHNATINQLEERIFGMFAMLVLVILISAWACRINFCVLQKHGNKTKEGSGCFATAASERTFAEYINGIYFVFQELANTLTALTGYGLRLKTFQKVNVFLNCFAVSLAAPSA